MPDKPARLFRCAKFRGPPQKAVTIAARVGMKASATSARVKPHRLKLCCTVARRARSENANTAVGVPGLVALEEGVGAGFGSGVGFGVGGVPILAG